MTNKYLNIDICSFDDLDDLHIVIADEFEKLKSESEYIAIYAKRELINNLFTDLICEDFTLGYANIDMIDDKLEDRVYVMLIRGDGVVSIEPAYSDKKDIMTHDAKSAIIYMDECDQDIIDYCVESDKNVILFDFDVDEFFDEDECDCCGCDLDECVCRGENKSERYIEYSKDEDGNMHGFTASKSDGNSYFGYSFYTSDKLDMNDIRGLLKDMGF